MAQAQEVAPVSSQDEVLRLMRVEATSVHRALIDSDAAGLEAQFERALTAPVYSGTLKHPYEVCVKAAAQCTSSRRAMAGLEAWLETYPESVHAKTAKGAVRIDRAWDARGGGWAREVPRRAWEVFHRRLGEAKELLESAAEGSTSPVPCGLLVEVSMGLGLGLEESRAYFDRAAALEPLAADAALAMLTQLFPKWGGSWPEAVRFVEELEAAHPSAALPAYLWL